MSIKIITGYSEPEWQDVKDMFYTNFTPDDWDYIIIGDSEYDVQLLAEKLQVCDYKIKLINNQWVAVTYHG